MAFEIINLLTYLLSTTTVAPTITLQQPATSATSTTTTVLHATTTAAATTTTTTTLSAQIEADASVAVTSIHSLVTQPGAFPQDGKHKTTSVLKFYSRMSVLIIYFRNNGMKTVFINRLCFQTLSETAKFCIKL